MNTQPENNNKLFLYLIAGILAAVAGFMAVYSNLGGSGNGDNVVAPKQNEKKYSKGHMTAFVVRRKPTQVPEFKFVDADGAEKTLKDWSGKVVVLNLWATWCGPCRHEMPSFDRLKAKFGADNFDVVAISIDQGGRDKPAQFLKKIKIKNLKLYHDPKALLNVTLRVPGMPTTLLIGRDGKEIGRLAGPAEWDSEDAIKLVQAALDGNLSRK